MAATAPDNRYLCSRQKRREEHKTVALLTSIPVSVSHLLLHKIPLQNLVPQKSNCLLVHDSGSELGLGSGGSSSGLVGSLM